MLSTSHAEVIEILTVKKKKKINFFCTSRISHIALSTKHYTMKWKYL